MGAEAKTAAMRDPAHDGWQGTTDGRPWMLRSLVVLFRWVNIRCLYAVMSVVVVFYMLANGRNRRAIARLFREHLGYGRWRTLCAVYANHFRFGQVILDRFAVYAGCRFRVEIEHNDYYNELASAPGGFIMVSSHVGNYELAGYTLRPEQKRFHALVYAGEKQTVMQNRAKCFAGNNIEMVPVLRDMSHLFIANRALEEGDIVGMPGDRLFGSPKSVRLPGCSGPLPAGPLCPGRPARGPDAVDLRDEGGRETLPDLRRSYRCG